MAQSNLSPRSSSTYDDEDRQQIINLIRSLESGCEDSSQPASPESITQPLTPYSDNLFDDSDIRRLYTDDFDAIFSLN